MGDRPSCELAIGKAYCYPAERHIRKHGPGGYSDYEQYRDWLRDEFSFRCVVCLRREAWVGRVGGFHIDHISPQADVPQKRLDYDNLIYLCASCNLLKSAHGIPDPCTLCLRECLRVSEDGKISALNEHGQRLIGVFRLDAHEFAQYRSKIIQLIQTYTRLKNHHELKSWLGFPDELPDLRKKKPPQNTRPEGAKNCFYAQRERGELPDFY